MTSVDLEQIVFTTTELYGVKLLMAHDFRDISH
jgi:hypothetical protein